VAPAACSPANCSGAYFFLGISPPFLRPRLLTLHLGQFSGGQVTAGRPTGLFRRYEKGYHVAGMALRGGG